MAAASGLLASAGRAALIGITNRDERRRRRGYDFLRHEQGLSIDYIDRNIRYNDLLRVGDLLLEKPSAKESADAAEAPKTDN